ncbi:hypothetical protein ACWPM1_13785 [Tsuneonella sp. HG249]
MHMMTSERQRIISYIRRQADHCHEVSNSLPDDYLIDAGPRSVWLAIAGALSSVADDINRGQHLMSNEW